MSGTTSRIVRSLKPGQRGERASYPGGGLLPPLSFLLAGAMATASWAGTSDGAAALQAVRDELVQRAGCDSVRVTFSGGVEAELARLEAVEAIVDRDAARREDPNGGERFLVRVRGRRSGRAIEWTTFASVQCFGPYYVAARAVSRGGRVVGADLTPISGWHRASALTPDAPLEPSLYAPRGLALGAEVSRDEVREAPLVARATLVTIRYHAPGLELAGRGLARADGWVGDRVSVRLEGAIRDCEASVIGPNEVEVSLGAPPRLEENP